MKKSIRIKFVLFVTILIAGVILLQVLSNVFFAKSYFIANKTNEMENMFDSLKTNIAYHDSIEKAMMHYVEVENIHIVVTDQNNNLIYGSYNSNELDYQENASRYSLNPKVIFDINQRTKKESLTLFGMISTPEINYYVVLDTPISAVERSVELINELNIYIAFISLLIGALVTWYWGSRIVKPISEIDRVAQNVANLDFSKVLIPPYSDDEIGRLSKNINSMSEQLSHLILSLKAANTKLEDDVTLEKKINSMRQEFIANVSHELKSPLALLVMYCENLRDNLPGIDETFYYNVIVDESMRLSELVNKLLNISSIENGLTKMNKDKIDYTSFTKWVCAKKEVLIEKKEIIIETNFEPGVVINGDGFFLEQAMTNLIDNAIRHTSKNKQITITLSKENEHAKFSIKNEGLCISNDDIDKIWDSFYKVDKSHTPTNETHAGLGLYIVRTIVDAHFGEYGATTLENGMEFWFNIPIYDFSIE